MPRFKLTYHELNEVVFDEIEAATLQDAENKINIENIPYEIAEISSTIHHATMDGETILRRGHSPTPDEIDSIRAWVRFGTGDQAGTDEAIEALDAIKRILQEEEND